MHIGTCIAAETGPLSWISTWIREAAAMAVGWMMRYSDVEFVKYLTAITIQDKTSHAHGGHGMDTCDNSR